MAGRGSGRNLLELVSAAMKKKIILGAIIMVVVALTLSLVLLNSCQKELEQALLHREIPTFRWNDMVSTSDGSIDLRELWEKPTGYPKTGWVD